MNLINGAQSSKAPALKLSNKAYMSEREFSWVKNGRCWVFGHDIPHMGGVVPMHIVSQMRTDPQEIVPHLFEESIPGFHEKCAPGDVIVAGRNFGMGAKMQGYIAMKALGLGLLCESMSFLAYREAIGIGLPVLTGCDGVLDTCNSGDLLEVDFKSGAFYNKSQNTEYSYSGVPEALQDVLSYGGTTGWLANWWHLRKTVQIE